MKIGILTQPLHNNYGGLLQAYALQHYLKKQGHDVLTVDFSNNSKPRLWGIRGIVLNIVKKYLLRRPILRIFPLNNKIKKEVGRHTNRFTAEYIQTTQPINSLDEFDYIKQYQFDAYIVGSDQVWRPTYSYGIPAFFLHFLSENKNIRRIAYVASFGVDHSNEFTKYFVKFLLLVVLAESLSGTLMTLASATGRIEKYQLVVGSILLLNLPISYFLIYQGFDAHYSIYVQLLLSLIALLARLIVLEKQFKNLISDFLKIVVIRSVSVMVVTFFIVDILQQMFEFNNNAIEFMVMLILTISVLLISVITIGLEKKELNWIRINITNYLVRHN